MKYGVVQILSLLNEPSTIGCAVPKQISVFACGDEICVQDIFTPPLSDLVNAWGIMKAPLLTVLRKSLKNSMKDEKKNENWFSIYKCFWS